jgi:hypothetical protein
MIPEIVEASCVHGFILHLRFADGTEGDVDLEHELDGPIFEPLRDPRYFAQFTVNPELRTITWPNGADFAPEFLYEMIPVCAAV